MFSVAGMTPRRGRTILPCAMSSGTTSFTVSTGTAKPIPALAPDGLAICVFTPMRRPALSSSGPPELPGLIAASVWMTFWILRPFRDSIVRPSALTTPVVSVSSRPNGFPIANTFWPTCSPLLVPTRIGGSFSGGAEILRTARSLSSSTPTTVAFQFDWSESVTTKESPDEDVRIRDDVSLPVPQEARARALRHLGHLEEVDRAPRERRDVDDGRARGLEERDRGLLVLGEIAARDDGARLRPGRPRAFGGAGPMPSRCSAPPRRR